MSLRIQPGDDLLFVKQSLRDELKRRRDFHGVSIDPNRISLYKSATTDFNLFETSAAYKGDKITDRRFDFNSSEGLFYATLDLCKSFIL